MGYTLKDHNCELSTFILLPFLRFTLLCRLASVLTDLGVFLTIEVYFSFENDDRERSGLIVGKVRFCPLVAVEQQRLVQPTRLLVRQVTDQRAVVKVGKESLRLFHSYQLLHLCRDRSEEHTSELQSRE